MQWKNNAVFRICALGLAVCCIISIVSLQFKYNSLKARRNALKEEIAAAQERVDVLQEALETPFDDDYVIKIAREKLNYRLPEEIVFYNDLVK